MDRKRHGLRGERGRFVARSGNELKRGRGAGRQGRPQVRKKHERALTAAEIGGFLTILGETCNVSLAAREIGRSARLFYDLRRREAGFRCAWEEVLREGYELLEMEMIHRARFGIIKDVFHHGKKTGTTRVINEAMALRLLSLHRRSLERLRSADSGGRRDAKEIFDELAARLAEIKEEEAAKARKAGDDRS
ncbi:MAG TPA: hypothetical protein VF650_04190 [Allosphingosinicella sp.]|jgi:hypothetical protein